MKFNLGRKSRVAVSLGIIMLGALATASGWASDMESRVNMATEILREKQHSDYPIPVALLQHAKGIAIFSVTKAGLGIGGQGGQGIVVLRKNTLLSHSWTAPVAFNVGGVSVGAQIGVAKSQYIVLLNSDDAVNRFTGSGKLNWNATATGTAGGNSATERASTEEMEHWEAIVYKDTNGLFGGATLGGTDIEREDSVNEEAYGNNVQVTNILSGSVPAPEYTHNLYRYLNGKL